MSYKTNKEVEKGIREEFQVFADSIIWSNDDGSEKYLGVGNMADWWLEKIFSLRFSDRKAVIEECIEVVAETQYDCQCSGLECDLNCANVHRSLALSNLTRLKEMK